MAVHRPETEDEVAAVLRDARGPLAVRGGGTRSPAADPPAEGDTLSVAGLTGITLYEPGALTIVARAGTPLREVVEALAAEGQHLPFEPMDHRPLLGTEGDPTVGGMAAMNVSGPRRVQANACRDAMIGVRFVDGTGAVVKNGGRVMKNVTGYDLVKLMAGSRGTLGVLTEVGFKVLPAPATARTVVLDGLSPARSVAAMASALGSPFEVTGAARDAAGRTLLRVEGSDLSTRYRAEALVARLAGFGSATVEDGTDWTAIRDIRAFSGTEGDVWRVSVKPSDAPRLLEAGGAGRFVLDWGGGLIWAEVPAGCDLRTRMAGIPGHATIVRAAPETRDRLGVLHPEAAGVAALSDALRRRFDPRGILGARRVAA